MFAASVNIIICGLALKLFVNITSSTRLIFKINIASSKFLEPISYNSLTNSTLAKSVCCFSTHLGLKLKFALIAVLFQLYKNRSVWFQLYKIEHLL